MPIAQDGKEAENGLFDIKTIHCLESYQTEKLQTAWKDWNLRPSEDIENNRLAQVET